jgi:hypothetical protein
MGLIIRGLTNLWLFGIKDEPVFFFSWFNCKGLLLVLMGAGAPFWRGCAFGCAANGPCFTEYEAKLGVNRAS